MTPEDFRRAKEVLQEALDRDPGERSAFLDAACAGDIELRRRVEELLACDQSMGDFLATPAVELVELATANLAGASDDFPDQAWNSDSPERSELTGQRIGRYRVTGLIGKGGMGAVYRAVRDDDFHMQVAVKLLKRGTDTETALNRFRVERQILAGLQHPNIARLLDGGATESGLPYFVMEYVDGKPLVEYAAPLSIRQRLELFRSVCSAVQYAHQKQIVHRDIKPANILVTPEGVPKLLDFGIAKLLRPAAGAATTTAGVHLMTPDYASPEQVRDEPVTPATDVYSLGAVLYELLTGQRAHHVENCSLEAIRAEICTKEPKKPSSVSKHLDPDLDRIVMMALRKEPERRYASVEQLSEDLGRFLQDLPIQARKGNLSYSSGKFLKRNRVPTLAAAFGAALVLALVAWLNLWRGARGGLDASARSIVVLPFSDVSPDKNQEYFSDGVTEQLRSALAQTWGLQVAGRVSSAQFNQQTADYRLIGRKLHVAAILEGSVCKEGQRVRVTAKLIKATDGHHLWSETFDRGITDIIAVQDEIGRRVTTALNVKLLEDKRPTSSSRSTNPEAYNAYLWGQYLQARLDGPHIEKAIGYFEQAIKLDPRYAAAWAGLGECRRIQANWPRAREAVERAVALDANLAEGHAAMGAIRLSHDWDWAGAAASLHRAMELDPGNLHAIRNTGVLAARLGHWDEAIALQRLAIALDPLDPAAYNNLGSALYRSGRLDEAKTSLEKLLELVPSSPGAYAFLSRVYLAQSRPWQALAEVQKEKHTMLRLCGLALAYHALGRKQESDANLAKLIGGFQANSAYQIAEVYAFRGETERAFDWLDRADQERDPGLIGAKGDVLLKGLERDPRYAALLQRLGLPLD
jgi:eukaryotic-like serine/threonine-protein kinase